MLSLEDNLNKIKLLYSNVEDSCCIFFIINDNIENDILIKDYIQNMGLGFNMLDMSELSINCIDEYIKQCLKGPVCIFNINGFYNKTKKEILNIETLYMNMFNLPRDKFYLKNKIKIIVLVKENEYNMFRSDFGDDFYSYSMCTLDFNKDKQLIKRKTINYNL